jgi:hypothetical protein
MNNEAAITPSITNQQGKLDFFYPFKGNGAILDSVFLFFLPFIIKDLPYLKYLSAVFAEQISTPYFVLAAPSNSAI